MEYDTIEVAKRIVLKIIQLREEIERMPKWLHGCNKVKRMKLKLKALESIVQ